MPKIEYSNLSVMAGHKSHQHSLRNQTHSHRLQKQSHADFDTTKSTIREMNKWPDGHKQSRERTRRLKNKCI